MRRNLLLGLAVAAIGAVGMGSAVARPQAAASQTTTSMPPAANPADVASVDAIMAATYDVISGPATKKRDWERFRSLFYPGARLISLGPKKDGDGLAARVLTPDDYVERAGKYFDTHGFFEHEVSRKTEAWGNLQQIFSTYESRNNAEDAKPFARGINSFQLINDGKRWWVMTILWEEESEKVPLTPEFLTPKK